jgi:tight adherence protein B
MLFGAVWLFLRASDQEQQDDVRLRLRVTGTDEVDTESSSMRDIRNPLIRSICHLFWRAGSDVAPRTVLNVLLLVLGIAILLTVIAGLVPAATITGLVVLVFYVVLAQRASRRRIKAIEQLPSFLEAVIRVLAAGNTFEESLVQAARESPDPIRPIFTSIGRQVRLGAPIDQVLAEAGNIYKIRDLNVIALAASINRKYGGSMRSVLKSLIVAIRQRGSSAKELRALTAETRLSAYILASITVGIFFYLFLSNRQYYDSMLSTRIGTIVLASSAGMVVSGFIVLWRMLKSIDEADS